MTEAQADKIAEAILELLQSIPNPDKADLSVAIYRAGNEPELVKEAPVVGEPKEGE